MDRKDFLLLVLDAAEGKHLTPVQLQKSLFLIDNAHLRETPDSFYNFEPHHYGPFDVSIYHDADLLQQKNQVVRIPSPAGTWTDTSITSRGHGRAKELEEELSSGSKEFISEVVQWVQSQTFSQLVRGIYEKFPKFRENSVFQE